MNTIVQKVRESAKHTWSQDLALQLMQQFGLFHWKFNWNTRKTQMGLCRYPHAGRPGSIELSWHFVRLNADEEIEDTIRHEIAHALAGSGAGHGPEWVKMCKVTGAKPNRCSDKYMPRGRWQATCPTCKRQFTKHRKPKSLSGWHCLQCGPIVGAVTYTLAE